MFFVNPEYLRERVVALEPAHFEVMVRRQCGDMKSILRNEYA